MTKLDARALNRATLARQLLLERADLPVVESVERLGGLQAQEPRPPFVGLWSRLQGFDPAALRAAVESREVVRATAMRATLHLVSARHYQRWRPALQPLLTAAMRGVLKDRADTVPLPALLTAATALLTDGPKTFEALRAALLEQFPDADPRAMGYVVRTQLPLVQVPADVRWGYVPGGEFTAATAWLGVDLNGDPDPADLVRAYLAAFGPASAADMTTWSGLKGMKPVFERLRDEMVRFTDPLGRELLDLPGAPRPSGDTPAPARFLPEFDSLVLAHADRGRLLDPDDRGRLVTKNLRVLASFLIDGRVAGTWTLKGGKRAVLTLAPFQPLAAPDRGALEIEGDALARFLEPNCQTVEIV